MTQDQTAAALTTAHANGIAVGETRERERWVKAIAEEREEWSPSRHVAAGGAVAALRAVLARMGIAQ